MGRILALDYGAKKTGIAVSDPMQIIATGLNTVATKDLFKFIIDYTKIEDVEKIVIGESKNLDNSKTEIALEIENFATKLQALLPNISFHWVDERFTSKMAKQSMLMSGMKKKKRQQKELVDEISATIILQSFMNTTI